LKEKLKGEDTAEIRTATEKLAAVSQKLGQAMYANAQAQSPGSATGDTGQSGSGTAPDGEEEVVDAEIVDEDKQEGSTG
ncbi:molecular chaperone DnaK, partial [Streptomyces sp. NPDC023998]